MFGLCDRQLDGCVSNGKLEFRCLASLCEYVDAVGAAGLYYNDRAVAGYEDALRLYDLHSERLPLG